MKVAPLDVKMDGANAVADEIGGTAVACDVTSSDSAEAAIAAAREAHGVASLLVNCAGIATPGRIVGRNGPLPLEAYASVIQFNLIGSFNMIRLFGADLYGTDPMTDGQRGLIVNTASVAATEGQIGQAAYASSKGGIVSLTLVAAREFASQGIRVNTIAPGPDRHPDDGGPAREGARKPGPAAGVSQAAGTSRRIRTAGHAYVRKRADQWRGTTPRRGPAHGRALAPQ